MADIIPLLMGKNTCQYSNSLEPELNEKNKKYFLTIFLNFLLNFLKFLELKM